MKGPSPLVCQLREVLQEYLNKHKKMTVHRLSKKCGVAATTLSRILNFETKADPRPTTVMAIITTLSQEYNIGYLMEHYKGPIAESLLGPFQTMLSPQQKSQQLIDLLNDRIIFMIYHLAGQKRGIHPDKLVHIMGHGVLPVIEDLLKHKILVQKNEMLHLLSKEYDLPISLYQKHIQELIRFTQYGSEFVEEGLFKFSTQSISDKCYLDIKKILENAFLQIKEITSKKENEGPVPFFTTLVLDSFETPTKKNYTDRL